MLLGRREGCAWGAILMGENETYVSFIVILCHCVALFVLFRYGRSQRVASQCLWPNQWWFWKDTQNVWASSRGIQPLATSFWVQVPPAKEAAKLRSFCCKQDGVEKCGLNELSEKEHSKPFSCSFLFQAVIMWLLCGMWALQKSFTTLTICILTSFIMSAGTGMAVCSVQLVRTKVCASLIHVVGKL